MSSHTSLHSLNEVTKEDLQEIQQVRFRNKQLFRLVILLIFPICLVLAVCTLHTERTVSEKREFDATQDIVQVNRDIVDLVLTIQVERGRSTQYVSSSGAHDVAEVLDHTYRDVDKKVLELTKWPKVEEGFLNAAPTRAEFLAQHYRYRGQVQALIQPITNVLRYYSSLTGTFLQWAIYLQEGLPLNKLWTKVVAKFFMFAGIDRVGLLRALGSMHYYTCELEPNLLGWFIQLRSEVSLMIDSAIANAPEAFEDFYSAHGPGKPMNDMLSRKINQILSKDYTSQCQRFDTGYRARLSEEWFANTTKIIALLKRSVTSVDKIVIEGLEELSDHKSTTLATFLTIAVIVLAICIATSFWYSSKVYFLLSAAGHQASKITKKGEELHFQKEKTSYLLEQLLPESIATAFRNYETVNAESFDSVTFCYSDIPMFNQIGQWSTPNQIVDFLNELYSRVEVNACKFDIYRVGTNNDVTYLVSGVPRRNGRQHIIEMANFSLSLLRDLEANPVANFTGATTASIRIGIHTGPVISCVVGSRMPRFCAIGEDANMAHLMMDSGTSSKIHASEGFHQALQVMANKHLFELEPRMKTVVHVKGEQVQTYWLKYAKRFDGAQPGPSSS